MERRRRGSVSGRMNGTEAKAAASGTTRRHGNRGADGIGEAGNRCDGRGAVPAPPRPAAK